jgi:cytochrome c oxidase cbb3-type subunit 3
MRLMVLALSVCWAALLSGCGHAPGDPPNPILRPAEVSDFASLYNENCAACHGANGQNGPAIDLANPEYQALVDDATLRKWISGGMPGTEMAAFAQSAGGMLTDAQVNALIAGMRRQWLQPNVYGNAKPPSYAQSQAGDPHRGQQNYQARCAACHDSSRQQITSQNYLSLIGDQALRSIIIAGRPDIGQPDWQHDGPGGKAAAPLSAQEVDDIVTYLGSLRNLAPVQAAPSAQSGR